jgi:hypothetical protein
MAEKNDFKSFEEKELEEYEKQAQADADSFSETPMLVLDYDVRNEEEDRAFKAYQKKFVYPHNWKVTAAFGVVAAAFIVSIIKNPDTYLPYVLLAICVITVALTWYNGIRIRKYLVKALKNLEGDKYRFTLYESGFTIETIVTEEEKQAEDYVPIKPRRVHLGDNSDINNDTVEVIENDEMFIIILEKETFYVLCKRLMDDEQQKILRDKLTGELAEGYHLITDK